jgi:hypothetical protein
MLRSAHLQGGFERVYGAHDDPAGCPRYGCCMYNEYDDLADVELRWRHIEHALNSCACGLDGAKELKADLRVAVGAAAPLAFRRILCTESGASTVGRRTVNSF